MAKTDSAYQQKSHVNASDFFQNMRKKAKKVADDVALERTYKMLDILRHRKIMENVGGGLSRWPRWDGSNGVPSKKSFSFWEAQARPNGEYWIVNKVTGQGATIEDYNYPRALATGKGWNKRTRGSLLLGSKLVRQGTLIFSEQMPRGLDPWLKRQRHLLNAELIKRIGTIT